MQLDSADESTDLLEEHDAPAQQEQQEQAAVPVFKSRADEELALMWAHNPRLTMGVVNQFLRIARLGGLTFRSATALMETIDILPGENCVSVL